jgi:hypothetical protein
MKILVSMFIGITSAFLAELSESILETAKSVVKIHYSVRHDICNTTALTFLNMTAVVDCPIVFVLNNSPHSD